MARINYYHATPEELERHAEATDTGLLNRYFAGTPQKKQPVSLPDEYPDDPNDSTYQEEMEYHYRTNPTRRERIESAGSRARDIGKKAVGAGASAARGAYDVGSAFNTAINRGGTDPMIRRIASGSGFSMSGSQPRTQRSQPQQQGAPGKIYITTCDEYGNCKMKKVSTGPSAPRKRRAPGWAAGVLGGNDPGFV